MSVRVPRRDRGPLRRRRAGLTLIETLLAVAILGIALSVLVAAAGQALGVVRRARNFATARHLLDIVELENPIPDLAEAAGMIESGGFDPPYADYSWERTVEPMLDLMGEETGYYLIRTRVRWSDRGQETFEELVTGAYAPTETKGVVPNAEAMEAETGEADGAVAGGLRAPAPVGRRGRSGGPDLRNDGRRGPEGLDLERGFRGAPGRGDPRAGAGVEGRLPRSLRDLMRAAMGRGRERGTGPNVRPPPGSGRAGAGRAFTAGRQAVGGGAISTLPPAPPFAPPAPGGFRDGPPPPPGF